VSFETGVDSFKIKSFKLKQIYPATTASVSLFCILCIQVFWKKSFKPMRNQFYN